MTSSAMRGFRRGFMLAATGIIWAAGPLRAQDVEEPLPEQQRSQLPPGAVVQSLDSGPGAELRRNLNTLAENPRSLDALIGAGRAALNLRDGEAASGFFTRAQQIAPDDPRVKAGMGSAALMSERPEQALILFTEAAQRGAPEAEIAGDRGLAYDMVGDPRHAQQDYALALRRRNDPEIERRLALSLAISGQREAALRVIDGQLRRQDRAAWRTQAFVLALTGDPSGADDTARRMMSASNAQALSPFFARLASLSPAQKAAAVNFGRFPSDGRTARYASNADTSADPGALAMAQGQPQRWTQSQPVQPPQARPMQSASNAPRRRPDLDEERVGSLIRRPREDVAPAVRPQQRIETAQAQPRRFAPAAAPADADDRDEPDDAQQQPDNERQQGAVSRPREAPAFVAGGNFTLDASHEQSRPQMPVQPPVQAPVQSATPGFGPAEQGQLPSVRRFESVTVQSAQPDPLRSMPGTRPAFSDVANEVRTLPDGSAAAGSAALSPAERQARDAAARDAEARYRAGGAPARTGSASASAGTGRYWVQIAHGGVRSALAVQYRQVHAQAPGLIESHNAWTVADRSTNRLLIGPFDDQSGAQAYIDQLSQRQIAAIPWTSAGQSVDRLQGGGASSSSSSSRVRAPQAEQQAPVSRASRNRQAAEADAGTSGRHGSSRRSGRAAAADSEDQPTSRSRSGRGSASSGERFNLHTRAGRAAAAAAAAEERPNLHTRAGRAAAAAAAAEERNAAHGRSARNRSGSDERGSSRTRSGRSGSNDSDSHGASGRNRHGSGNDEAASSSRSRNGHGRASTGDTSQANRGRTSQQHRPSANDTRTARGRSSEEQRPAPSRRRSHQ